jgi:pilus assembly protein CpaE
MNTGNRIKAVIVENIPQVQKRFEKLLGLIEGVDIINVVSSAQDATEIVNVSRPDVLLIDVNLPDMNGIQFAEILRRDHPSTQVIIISQDRFGETVLQALRTGASDFLTHDVSINELTSAIQRAGELATEERRKSLPRGEVDSIGIKRGIITDYSETGKIISVYSPKGGTGATTVAINLAVALRDSESTVALIDGNMQFGDVGILLNEVSNFSILDLVERIYELDKKILDDVMVLHKSSGIHILAAPPRPELAEKVTGNAFTSILEYLREIFDYIIVNTSSYITDPCLAALDAAEVVILVTTQEISAIRSTHSFLDLWDVMGLRKDRILLTLNRYQKQRTITPEKISDRLKMPIPVTIVEDEETVYRSLNLGIPFMVDRGDTSVAKSIQEITEQVNLKVSQLEPGRFRLFS